MDPLKNTNDDCYPCQILDENTHRLIIYNNSLQLLVRISFFSWFERVQLYALWFFSFVFSSADRIFWCFQRRSFGFFFILTLRQIVLSSREKGRVFALVGLAVLIKLCSLMMFCQMQCFCCISLFFKLCFVQEFLLRLTQRLLLIILCVFFQN